MRAACTFGRTSLPRAHGAGADRRGGRGLIVGEGAGLGAVGFRYLILAFTYLLTGHRDYRLLAATALATSLTMWIGGSGGVFAPFQFMGAKLGQRLRHDRSPPHAPPRGGPYGGSSRSMRPSTGCRRARDSLPVIDDDGRLLGIVAATDLSPPPISSKLSVPSPTNPGSSPT